MRYVDRLTVAAPASLSIADGPGAGELVEARAYYGAMPIPAKAFDFKAYKADDVKSALRQLFHGKCAYCESSYQATQPPDIEHFRPKGGVEDCAGHPGYWWLAMKWSNLLPSCIDCNRRRRQTSAAGFNTLEDLERALLQRGDEQLGKKDSFPTSDGFWAAPENDPETSEHPLLIDPTRTNPQDHLVWRVDDELAIVLPRVVEGIECQRAVASIHIYGLNRLGLTVGRTRLLKGLKVAVQQINMLIAISETVDEIEQASIVRVVMKIVEGIKEHAKANAPYSAMAQAFIDTYCAHLETAG